MKKIFSYLKDITTQRGPSLALRVRQGHQVIVVPCKPGQNLMDVTNKIVNQDVTIYGLCDKQLSCTTCSVQIESHFDKIKEPTEEELDVLAQVKNSTEKTRMACQIVMSSELNNLTISIPYKKEPKKGARKFMGGE